MTQTRAMTSMQTIADWKTSIANAHWDINFSEFCRRAGFSKDRYAEEKWTQWQRLAQALAAFDATTLERIVQPEAPKSEVQP